MNDFKELLTMGKAQGFINYLDLKEYIPVELRDENEVLEDIIQMVNDLGIEIRYKKAEILRIHPDKDDR